MPRRPGATPAEPTQAAVLSPTRFVAFCFRDTAGRPVVQAPVHDELQAFLSAHRLALVELPRDHGKSLQVCARIVWELGLNPGLRVKLVCATATRAAERSRFLRDAITANDRVRVAFPHMTPDRPWGAGAFTVTRPAAAIDPSVSAVGVNTSSTGGRADLLVCDDLVDSDALHSHASRQKTKDLFRHNLMNLLEPDGRMWSLFTPWHAQDLNAELKASGDYPVFRRPVGANLEPVWAEKWPTEALARRKREIGDASFARAFQLLNADEGERVIRPEWITFWDEVVPRDGFETVVLSVDPAASAGAAADATALVTVGRLADSNEVRVLDAVAVRAAAPELAEHIAAANARWNPDRIVFESNGGFDAVRAMYVRDARFGAKLVGVTQSKSKRARLSALSVPVQNATVKLRGGGGRVDASQRELFDEMTAFPFGHHDDRADALATAVADLLGRPTPRVWV